MTRQEILEEAIRIVTKDRNATHGDPENNFATIARYWNNYLQAGGIIEKGVGDDGLLTSEDIAALMILMKVSRLATSRNNIDHWVDIAGYAACGGEIAVKV